MLTDCLSSDVPGNVIKQATQYGQDLEKEALQALLQNLALHLKCEA